MLRKFYDALVRKDLKNASALLSSQVVINVTGSSNKSVNGEYFGIKGFMKFQSNMLDSFPEQGYGDSLHYKVVSHQGNTATGRITAKRHYKNGSVYREHVNQTFFIGQTGKIVSLNSNVTYTRLEAGNGTKKAR